MNFHGFIKFTQLSLQLMLEIRTTIQEYKFDDSQTFNRGKITNNFFDADQCGQAGK